VVGLGGSAPSAALIHAPLSLLPVAFPASRFQQVSCIVAFLAVQLLGRQTLSNTAV
jgi:hypothetical protein